ncbi:MAG: TIGR03668 family PPOX class F420-dependent oxidoreductase [Ilumatobacteraceae bacterium]
MDRVMMRKRVAAARVARLATVTVDGRPHLVPCCFVVDGDVMFTGVDDVKAKSTPALRRLDNIGLHPAVSVLVDHYDEDWLALWWVRMDGDARVLDPSAPEARTARRLLAAKYEPYRDQPISGPVISVQITRWVGWP